MSSIQKIDKTVLFVLICVTQVKWRKCVSYLDIEYLDIFLSIEKLDFMRVLFDKFLKFNFK